MENTKHLNGYIEEKDDTFYPTCRFCGKQTLPDAPYLSQNEAKRGGNDTLRLFRGTGISRKITQRKGTRRQYHKTSSKTRRFFGI